MPSKKLLQSLLCQSRLVWNRIRPCPCPCLTSLPLSRLAAIPQEPTWVEHHNSCQVCRAKFSMSTRKHHWYGGRMAACRVRYLSLLTAAVEQQPALRARAVQKVLFAAVRHPQIRSHEAGARL